MSHPALTHHTPSSPSRVRPRPVNPCTRQKIQTDRLSSDEPTKIPCPRSVLPGSVGQCRCSRPSVFSVRQNRRGNRTGQGRYEEGRKVGLLVVLPSPTTELRLKQSHLTSKTDTRTERRKGTPKEIRISCAYLHPDFPAGSHLESAYKTPGLVTLSKPKKASWPVFALRTIISSLPDLRRYREKAKEPSGGRGRGGEVYTPSSSGPTR
jgi:hypothetical protein